MFACCWEVSIEERSEPTETFLKPNYVVMTLWIELSPKAVEISRFCAIVASLKFLFWLYTILMEPLVGGFLAQGGKPSWLPSRLAFCRLPFSRSYDFLLLICMLRFSMNSCLRSAWELDARWLLFKLVWGRERARPDEIDIEW